MPEGYAGRGGRQGGLAAAIDCADAFDTDSGAVDEGRNQFVGESLVAVALQDMFQLPRLHGVNRSADLLGNGGIAGLVNRHLNDAASVGRRHVESLKSRCGNYYPPGEK
jgi:hypothetical protein